LTCAGTWRAPNTGAIATMAENRTNTCRKTQNCETAVAVRSIIRG
jgi:hypothetical protein